MYLVFSDVSKQIINYIFGTTDLVQIGAYLIGWNAICLNVGQVVGFWALASRDGGSGVPRGGFGVFKHPQNSEGPPKSCQTQPDCENC